MSQSDNQYDQDIMPSGHDESGEDQYVAIPCGGPLYVSNMVGPLTGVSRFETSMYQELQSLQDELFGESSDTWDDEILVDDLKIFTEDELVEKALEEAFRGGELNLDTSQEREENLKTRLSDGSNVPGNDACLQDLDKDIEAASPRADACVQNSERYNEIPVAGADACPQYSEGDTQAIVPSETLNLLPLKICDNKKSKGKSAKKQKQKPKPNLKKRKRSSKRNNSFNESYMAKVEELARIKQKQEDDKLSVRLHSFNGDRKSRECEAVCESGRRISSLKSTSASTKVKCSNTRDNIPVGSPETVLCVEVYHSKKKWTKTQEFLVLGRQLLTGLKDKIYCVTDEIMKKAGQYNPSGYFLVEDVFYNDMREYTSIDYSETILYWLENSKTDALGKWETILAGGIKQQQKKKPSSIDSQKQSLPTFRAVHMQNARFCDMEFRLGAGYLYCHQGDCKHVIVIRDMRLVHQGDVQNQAAYPLITYQMKFRRAKCSVCKIYAAQKITVDDKWAPINPCYFCDICYYMLHYADGSLLYTDFSVYDYIHD